MNYFVEKKKKTNLFYRKKIFYIIIFYFFRIDESFALAPTYPQVQWRNQTYVVLLVENILCVGLILEFWKICFTYEKKCR